MANEQNQYKLQSTADGKGGVYIIKLDKEGNLTVWYCKGGRQRLAS